MKQIDTLCFSGGGMKGVAYHGVLSYLEKNKYISMKKIKTFAGASIGGIISFVFTLGYTVDEIIEFTLNFNFQNLEPDINCETIFTQYGLCTNQKIEITLIHFLKNKFNISDVTFLELYKLTNITLILNGTNLTDYICERFDHLNTPNMSVITALKITSCIPIYFTPILYNNKYYVDGGISNNFPLTYCNKETTLGLLINDDKRPIDSLQSILLGCITTMLKYQFEYYFKDYNIIELDELKIESLEYGLTKEIKQSMISMGERCGEKYVKSLNTKQDNAEQDNIVVNDNIIQIILNITT